MPAPSAFAGGASACKRNDVVIAGYFSCIPVLYLLSTFPGAAFVVALLPLGTFGPPGRSVRNRALRAAGGDRRVRFDDGVELVDVAQQQFAWTALVVHDVAHLHSLVHVERNAGNARMHFGRQYAG